VYHICCNMYYLGWLNQNVESVHVTRTNFKASTRLGTGRRKWKNDTMKKGFWMSQNTTKYLLGVIYLSWRHVSAAVLGHLPVINVYIWGKCTVWVIKYTYIYVYIHILWLILYSFLKYINLWPEYGPKQGPKHVVSLNK